MTETLQPRADHIAKWVSGRFGQRCSVGPPGSGRFEQMQKALECVNRNHIRLQRPSRRKYEILGLAFVDTGLRSALNLSLCWTCVSVSVVKNPNTISKIKPKLDRAPRSLWDLWDFRGLCENVCF